MQKNIRILFDATPIKKDPAGVGYVALNLLKNLLTYKDLQLVVYTRKGLAAIPDIGVNTHNLIIHETNHEFSYFGLGRFYFEQSYLPFLIKKYQPDILHLTTGFGVPILLNKKKLLLKILLTIHDLIPLTKYWELMTLIDRIFYRFSLINSLAKSDAIVTISKTTAKDLNKFFPNTSVKNITTIYDAVKPLELPKNSPEIWTQLKKKYEVREQYLFYLGGFAPRKNVERLVVSFHKFINNGKTDYQLILSGRMASSRNEDIQKTIQNIRSYIDKNNLEDYIKMIDYVTLEEKAILFTKAKFFIFLSLYEGFGLPVLEAFSVGTPVITSKNTSMEEIAGNYALYCNPMDENDIVDKIEFMILEYETYKKKAQIAMKELVPKFNWKDAGEKYYHIYKMLSQ